ncbi:hypothetical protein ABEB36_011766 [Hypothenemus hampei]|uniref:RNA-binding protein NOB1 n=1 Tax=Hypothenemus hampei TaxID=57062 RepID=A0ABD1E8Y4_HYPHA
MTKKQVEYLVADTTAFIQNAPLQDIAENVVTCQEVLDEITSKRQLRRLVTLPYDLKVKYVFPENVKIIRDFSLKTGDYQSLSATDLKVMALTYQMEKEMCGVDHLRTEPVAQRPTINTLESEPEMNPDISGFYAPGKEAPKIVDDEESSEKVPEKLDDLDLAQKFANLNCDQDLEIQDHEDILVAVESEDESSSADDCESNNDEGWITPSNVQQAKKQVNSRLLEEKHVKVACMTTDFAMQNVLKQMKLNVSSLDGRMITQLRTFILRCTTCFKTTSIMTKEFCPKCGNKTLKKVSVSLDENGKLQIYINTKKPLSTRGTKYSLPRIQGGKHPNNPILVEDQPMAHNMPSRLSRTKNNPLNDDYIAD